MKERREVIELGIFLSFYRWWNRSKISKTVDVSANDIEKLLRENENVRNIKLFDSKYKVPDFKSMLSIISKDMVKYTYYQKEVYDCDNFAISFAGTVPMFYDVNNVGIAVGEVRDSNGNLLYYHAWNIFAALKDDGTVFLYMYEPQTGKFSSYKSGRVGDKYYIPHDIIWG